MCEAASTRALIERTVCFIWKASAYELLPPALWSHFLEGGAGGVAGTLEGSVICDCPNGAPPP
jgi:hypothetical protein